MVQSVLWKIAHYTRSFTLVAKRESRQSDMYVCVIYVNQDPKKCLLHFYTFETICIFFSCDLHWNDIYVTTARNMCDTR